MDSNQEDRIYSLQQALASLPRQEWEDHLKTACPLDLALREEVLRRLKAADEITQSSATRLAFAVSVSAEDTRSDLGGPVGLGSEPSLSPFFGNRFEIKRLIGSGGFGAVYEVFDRQTGRDVALKTLRRFGASDIYRLKREFRSLADVHHPNFVRLYELFVTDRDCFFTMELVPGGDFLERTQSLCSYPNPQVEEPQAGDGVREALRLLLLQLVEGVHALHALGKVHGDLKPANVLVTPDDRVVILDFGIVSEPGNAPGQSVSEIAGTPMYMAPEVLQGASPSEASDWYSIGALLFEVLVGRPPFDGGLSTVLQAKARGARPSVPESAADLWPQIATICSQLLDGDPNQRPDFDGIRTALGEERIARAGTTSATGSDLIGRAAQLASLHHSFRDVVASGLPALTTIEGESGIGKTALLRTFVAELATTDAIVLTGRCYERETVAYKALDSAIDALSHRLKKLPETQLDAVLPRHVASLVRMFPVLARVRRIADRAKRSGSPSSPYDERKRALASLRELLARIGDRWPIVLAIDDAQWGDADSASLLTELLLPPDAPRLLLVLCHRSADVEKGAFMPALLKSLGDSRAGIRHIHVPVGALDAGAAVDFAAELVAGNRELGQAIASESRGSPFFIRVLANYVATGAGIDEVVNLTSVLGETIQGLPQAARHLLETLSIAACPLELGVASAAAGSDSNAAAMIEVLRNADLVKTTTTPSGSALEPYHDRVREIVAGTIGRDRQLRLHHSLATALKENARADPETIAFHYDAAGEREDASRYAEQAATQAFAAFAFDRSARLFRKALDGNDEHTDASLRRQIGLGDALAAAGRGAEAAEAYLSASARTNSRDRIELTRRAAEQLLISGNVERGLIALRSVLTALHLRMPRSSLGALVSLLFRRALVNVRGLHFKERNQSSIAPERLTLIDTCWSASVGLSMVDTIRGTDFQARHLLLALSAGEPFRVARALALEAGYRGLAGRTTQKQAAGLLSQASAVADRLQEPYAMALVEMAGGALAWMNADWKSCLERSDQAERLLTDRCAAPAWETATAQIFSMAALLWMGDLSEHRRRMPALLRGARDRGDLYAEVSIPLLGYAHVTRLADDEPEAARETVQSLAAAWVTNRFDLQRFWATYARAEIELYMGRGNGAWREISSAARDVRGSMLLRSQTVRISWTYLIARCALAAANDNPRLVAKARWAARTLEREGVAWATTLAIAVRAALAAHAGDSVAAARFLVAAETGFGKAQMRLHEAATAWARSQVSADPLPGTTAERIFGSEGVRCPPKFASTLVPGRWSAT